MYRSADENCRRVGKQRRLLFSEFQRGGSGLVTCRKHPRNELLSCTITSLWKSAADCTATLTPLRTALCISQQSVSCLDQVCRLPSAGINACLKSTANNK